MSNTTENTKMLEKPYKLLNFTRENRKGVTAGSLQQLISIAHLRFNIPQEHRITIVLEQDGTEIDDEEYFATLEKNTSLMILQDEEKWIPVRSRNSTRHVIFVDDTDNCAYNSTKKTNKIMNFPNVPIESLVSSLHSEPSHISLLAETDLETLSDMDPDSLADIFSDRLFLESLKEASGKFLAEKRQADDSVALLEMLSSNNQVEDTSTT